LTDFEALRAGRRRLYDFCSVHLASVDFFRSGGGSYRLHEREPELGPELRHMTSTATCLESLLDCPGVELAERINWFVRQALARPDGGWTSEGSAGIYCRCRALPLIILYAPRNAFPRIRPHLERVFLQLNGGDRFGIGEADAKEDPPDRWYPPNAFHTFWALEAVERSKRFGMASRGLERRLRFPERRNAMLVWAWEVLGCQIALHEAKSAGRDTDQLLYALVIATRFSAASVYSQTTIRYRDLVKKSLEVFFSEQDPTGTWVHHEPLFHYREAGNAYCYIFESLTPLLKNALRTDAAWLRALLRPYARKLFELVTYAEATKVPLGKGRAVGWSSGHRTNVPFTESWATAAVFGCMQAMRRLVGIWTKEDALRELNHQAPLDAPESAILKLAARGQSWSEPSTVGEQLITMFVNPRRMSPHPEIIDPDERSVGETQARSAILFGPPGTSKTTLIQTLSAAVGWEYVELHPSHFVAGGLPNVQRTADEIFTRLMELDRCVVLFDEIDELMREREKEPDAFGRFLTTSMLPKLAELWKQRRIIYFVATNHIGHFDQALTRSQRFDALILVPPPAFATKKRRLLEILSALDSRVSIDVRVSATQVQKELDATAGKELKAQDELHEEHLLAKFVLLRWDQLEELAHILLRVARSKRPQRLVLDGPTLKSALKEITDPRLKQYGPYMEFLKDRARSGRDFGKDVVWLVEGPKPKSRKAQSMLRRANGSDWCIGTRELITDAAEANVEFSPDGSLKFGRSQRSPTSQPEPRRRPRARTRGH
jgi:hypothetical protein